MNVRSYEYLVAIADKGSLSKAAQALGISQPTLSSFLSNTERQLGHSLFERSGKTMIPTEAGQIYLTACRNIINVKHQAYHMIAGLNRQDRETFTLGVTPYRGSQVFSQIFSDFYQRYPDVQIILQEGYMEMMKRNIDDGSLSMALGTLLEEDMDSYYFCSQFYDELLLVVPSYHPLAEQGLDSGGSYPSIDIRLFADTPFVMWGKETTNRRLVSSFLERNGLTPTIVYESNNALLIDTMLQKNTGVGFLPFSFCKPDQNRMYFSFHPPLRSVSGLFCRKGQNLTQAQRYFMYLVIRQQIASPISGATYFNDISKELIREFEGG